MNSVLMGLFILEERDETGPRIASRTHGPRHSEGGYTSRTVARAIGTATLPSGVDRCNELLEQLKALGFVSVPHILVRHPASHTEPLWKLMAPVRQEIIRQRGEEHDQLIEGFWRQNLSWPEKISF